MSGRLLPWLAAAAGLLTGCTNLIQAEARPTSNFPYTWSQPEPQAAPAFAPAVAPAQAMPAAPSPLSLPAAGKPLPGGALVAVLDMKSRVRGPEAEQVDVIYFSNAVRIALKRQAPQIKVMTRENVLVLLQASGKSFADCEGECEVDTGRRLGADYVVSGDLLKVGTRLKLDLRLHETKEGQLLSGAAASGKTVDELDSSTVQAVTEMLTSVR